MCPGVANVLQPILKSSQTHEYDDDVDADVVEQVHKDNAFQTHEGTKVQILATAMIFDLGKQNNTNKTSQIHIYLFIYDFFHFIPTYFSLYFHFHCSFDILSSGVVVVVVTIIILFCYVVVADFSILSF